MQRDSATAKWSGIAPAPPDRAVGCGLRRPAPDEPADAAKPEAAVALSVACSTIEERARVASSMSRALADHVYVAPRIHGALPATFPRRLDAALYLVRPLGAGIYGSVCASGFRQSPSPVTLATALSSEAAASSAESAFWLPPPAISSSSSTPLTPLAPPPPLRDLTRLPLAVKVTPGGARPAVAVRESLLTDMLSALVKIRACPNLPCVYGTAVAYPTPTEVASARLKGEVPAGSVDIFQEMADCDLAAWMTNGPLRSEAEWMSVVFQVCAGIAWAARVYDIVNNDMYGRNVLLSRILAPTTPASSIDAEARAAARGSTCTRNGAPCPGGPVFRYALQSRAYGWRRFAVRTKCWLARPTDYALATSDRLRALGVDVAGHDGLASIYGPTPPDTSGPAPTTPTPASLASLVAAGNTESRHVIFHPYLNAYARDVAVLLATVAYGARAPLAVRQWAVNGLYTLYADVVARQPVAAPVAEPGVSPLFVAVVRAAQRSTAPSVLNRAFRQPDDLIDFMVGVLFDEAALSRAGLPSGLFADDAAAVATAGNQFFALPLLDTPPPVEPIVFGAPSPAPLQAVARALGVPL
ncbi:hypothetical protein pkur_cds_65 [Pandoravirus kuranda]|uniref:Uncharacterized protein n=2 Tax=Pandoravirus TaxID=2060084 RepID=A0AA95ECH5_9VIRU|nr:hypothetical protein pneo_cds_72 [Pandoravirus neocaledonia]AVK75679.1 hypothetical protein pneo_cds_72 [Pandoravirus neocaledonia]WBR14240.1 hypothetical protein pkur_cds_65 [Pandoravirus kuranda]